MVHSEHMMPPAPRRGIGVGAVLLVLLVTAVFLFLIFPFNTIPVQEWVLTLQTQLKAQAMALAPYAVVGVLGGIVGVAELTATFATYPREALQTRWARILVVVNMVAAILALIITQVTMPDGNMVLQVIAVGVGFQALIRTRFVLAKQIGGDGNGQGEVSLNLGWLYDQFQNLCRTQIDLELMNNRRTAVTRLLEYYPSLTQLYDIAWYTIIARATLTPEEEKSRLAELEKLIDPKAPEQFARSSIALMILENGGQAYVDLLLDQAMHPAAMSTGTAVLSANDLVRQITDKYSLEQLVGLSEQVSEVEEVKTWVVNAAKPDPATTEANQKAAIAHFLIKQVGQEKIQQTVGERP